MMPLQTSNQIENGTIDLIFQMYLVRSAKVATIKCLTHKNKFSPNYGAHKGCEDELLTFWENAW